MSTRSGKRVHNSFHENTMKSETDFTRSERKTRSKHTKENLDDINVSPKLKKRNYVAYPDTDEAGIDTVDSKTKEKSMRVLRKNALKERNILTSTESVEPAEENKKTTRSSRRTRKFEENSQDTQHEDPIEIPKPKKVKKKKVDMEVEVIKVPKQKSKKKKGRKSKSIIVENMEGEAHNSLNKSNMSVDSFHSAAGSPSRLEHSNHPQGVVPAENDLRQDIINTPENNIDKTESRKTRSSYKLQNNMLHESVAKKEKKRKSSVKVDHDNDLNLDTSEKEIFIQEKTPRGVSLKIQSESKDLTISEHTNSTSDLEKPNTSRKSTRNSNFDKTTTPIKINFDKNESMDTPTPKKKRKSIVKDKIGASQVTKTPIQEYPLIEKDSVTDSGQKSKKRRSSANFIKFTDNLTSPSKDKNKSLNITFDNDVEDNVTRKRSIIDAKLNLSNKASPIKFLENERNLVNDTFEKDSESRSDFIQEKKRIVDVTFDVTSSSLKSANEVSSPLKMFKETDLKHQSVINTTNENNSDTTQETEQAANNTFDKEVPEDKINTIFEKNTNENMKQKRKSSLQESKQSDNTEINSTFDTNQKKLDTTFDKNSISDTSMITLDKSEDSRISITSDESKSEEIILNTTPVLIESSMEVSLVNTTITPTKETTLTTEALLQVTPLKREGTFTKESELKSSPKLLHTPTKRMSLPSPGVTPFHINPSKEKSVLLNVTRSIEKRRSTLADVARTTKVMFCSPVNNPAVVAQNGRKVIKSNLKGSNKSFVFDDSVSADNRLARKRSYTSDAEEARAKRTRLGGARQLSVDRLSRPRTCSASAKLAEPTTPSKKPTTPSKKDAKSRTKLPNFAALHQKQFDKMESLNECQERKAKRAKQLLTPTGAINVLERISPKDKAVELEKPKEVPEKSKEASSKSKEPPKKPDTPIKSLPSLKSLNPGYTRFGFKLNLDVNPFSIPSKAKPKPKENKPKSLNKQPTLPSLAGATSLRREAAKQTIMREKSFSDRRNVRRTENRTVIKGVRTNRRFELQMRMREL